MELIIVLTLVAIITAAVVPMYSGSLSSVHADYSLRDIVALLKYAQERAVTDTTGYRFYLDPEQGEYWLMRLTNVDGELLFEEVTERQAERRTLPEYLQMETPKAFEDPDLNAYFIEFFPSGACDIGRIELTKDDNTLIRIETGGKLGQIKVTEK